MPVGSRPPLRAKRAGEGRGCALITSELEPTRAATECRVHNARRAPAMPAAHGGSAPGSGSRRSLPDRGAVAQKLIAEAPARDRGRDRGILWGVFAPVYPYDSAVIWVHRPIDTPHDRTVCSIVAAANKGRGPCMHTGRSPATAPHRHRCPGRATTPGASTPTPVHGSLLDRSDEKSGKSGNFGEGG
jgi:hypothetical protein